MEFMKLSTLTKQIAAQIKKDILSSVVVFPRTSSLAEDKPRAVIDVEGNIDWDRVKQAVTSHPELIALSAVEDVCLTLDCLKELSGPLYLESFDGIQIHRGGIDLLLIKNTKRNVGRTALLELNDYRRRLQQTLFPQPQQTSYVVTGIVVILASMAGVALWNWLTSSNNNVPNKATK